MAQNFFVVCPPTRLSLNKSGRLSSWHATNLTHDLNKNMASRNSALQSIECLIVDLYVKTVEACGLKEVNPPLIVLPH